MYHLVWVISSFVPVCFEDLNLFYIIFFSCIKMDSLHGRISERNKGDWSCVKCTFPIAEWFLSCLPSLLSPRHLPTINFFMFYLHALTLFNYKTNFSKNIIYSFYMPQMSFCMEIMWPKSLYVWWDFLQSLITLRFWEVFCLSTDPSESVNNWVS